ncbi:heme ABC transporter ATP-binding protein [Paraburkholderia sp. BL21I4N1]|uniref:heme ABC transporter ATP-binding protein n=1 Tax=Paraburkholderia sp. BL21I4N1 TaxID=1938801 RepID=UPI000CFDA3C4|nr:heme ABC transporter ATP-binding protein [Paraburkholderia sp. BL21I4N1]PQV54735.1 iron complex transport system ATP-binding protein [Paraburkholderia sp. BL21I4N1]
MLMTRHLSITRGDRPILRDLSLTVKPGCLTTLLGCNGAGKSTLLKALAGEFHGGGSTRPPQLSGTTTLNGESLDGMSSKRLARLRAVLPQASNPVFPFTVEEIVLLGRYPHAASGAVSRNDRRIVDEALTLAGAETLTGREITTLSGGELARVQFARVLAQIWPQEDDIGNASEQPTRYLLLDEPTAALDLAHQHRLLETVRALTRRWRIGALAIVHDPNLAARYADAIALLADGTIIAQGTPREIMQPALIERCFGFAVRMLDAGDGSAPVAVPA